MKTTIIFNLILLMGLFSLNAMGQHEHTTHKKESIEVDEVHPGQSVYHLKNAFKDHRKDEIKLADFKGKPVIIVMFYGKCTMVCSILIRDTKRLYNILSPSFRKQVKVLAVSFDVEKDTPEVLKSYAQNEELDIPNWHFVTGKHTDIKMLATMLGVRYQKTSSGYFTHSNLITILDKEGKIVKRLEGLNEPMDQAASFLEGMFENL